MNTEASVSEASPWPNRFAAAFGWAKLDHYRTSLEKARTQGARMILLRLKASSSLAYAGSGVTDLMGQ